MKNIQDAIEAWRALTDDERAMATAPLLDFFVRDSIEDSLALKALDLLRAAAEPEMSLCPGCLKRHQHSDNGSRWCQDCCEIIGKHLVDP